MFSLNQVLRFVERFINDSDKEKQTEPNIWFTRAKKKVVHDAKRVSFVNKESKFTISTIYNSS